MAALLNILVVEDSQDDTDMLIGALRRAGFTPNWKRVETEADFLVEIQSRPDLILSDYSMPHFNGLRAVKLLSESGLDIPFILISGTVGEDVAVEAMKHGAADYLLKDRIARLGNAVHQVLEKSQLRRERVLAEEELRRTHDALGRMVAHSPAVIYTLRMDGQKLILALISENLERLLGFTVAEGMGHDWWLEGLHPEDRDGAVSMLGEAIAAGGVSMEYRFRHKDGSYRWIEDSNRVLRDAAGQPLRIVGVWTDITQQKQLEEQLRQAQKMNAIGQLAGGVAHDFNNILAAILMQLGMLQDSPHLTLDTKESLKEVERETLRASNLTRQLLLFSRRQVAHVGPLDINRLINNLLNMLRRLLGENIEVTFLGASDANWVSADMGMMEQVVMNLCINARDAMSQGGRLTLSTALVEIEAQRVNPNPEARSGHFVCLSVTDTGCGMDKEVLKRIFEPFFTTKEVGKGTGLGLATVYGIVKQHEGWVEVESTVGQGSLFKVYLPAGAKLLDASAAPASEEIKGGSETILLVEDNPSVRRTVALSLRKLGYAVLEAGNGLEAMRLWEQHHQNIELLFTDMLMPGAITGLSLAERLNREKASLRVIISSGYSADLVEPHPVRGRRITYLPKPYQASTLAKMVRRCLDLSQ